MKENTMKKINQNYYEDKKKIHFCSGVDITFPWDHIKIQITSI